MYYVLEYWAYIYILNIIIFNVLYMLKVGYGDVTAFAIYASILFSVPSFIGSLLISLLIKKIFNASTVKWLFKLTVHTLIALILYITAISVLEVPFLYKLLKGSLTEMEEYFFISAMMSIIAATILCEVYVRIKKKTSYPY